MSKLEIWLIRISPIVKYFLENLCDCFYLLNLVELVYKHGKLFKKYILLQKNMSQINYDYSCWNEKVNASLLQLLPL